MWIARLRYPGSFIQGLSNDKGHTIQSLLFTAEHALVDAALSLTFFEASSRGGRGRDAWERRRAREQLLRERVTEKYAAQLDHVPQDQRWIALLDKREAIEAEARQLGWQEGDVPDEYEHRLPFLHARGFLFALDTLANILRVLAEEPWASPALVQVRDDWVAAFPQLKHVRDTAHHVEDRARGLDRNGKPLALAPVNNEMINAPGGALFLDSLINNRYGGTLSDGTYGEVEVSGNSLAAATSLVQRTIDTFSWKGPERVIPR